MEIRGQMVIRFDSTWDLYRGLRAWFTSLVKALETLPDDELAGLLRQRVPLAAAEDAQEDEFVSVKVEQEDGEEEGWWEYEQEWSNETDPTPAPCPTWQPPSPPGPPPPPPPTNYGTWQGQWVDNRPPPPPPPEPEALEKGKGRATNATKGPRKGSEGTPHRGKGGLKGKKGTRGSAAAEATARSYQRSIYKGDGRGGLYVRGGFIDSSGWFYQSLGFDSMHLFVFIHPP